MAWRRRLTSALVAAAAICAAPAPAQQASPLADRLTLPMPATDPTTAGKPAMFGPASIAKPDSEPLFDCGRGFQCRVRLRGVIDKNGGVAVEGTAFTW
jgi:hypothetical protein